MLPEDVKRALLSVESRFNADLEAVAAIRAHLEAQEAEIARLRTMLAGRGEDYSHLCKRCGNPYTPRAGESEDCPACGFDGITAHLQEQEKANVR